jgi:hypothetical protein
MKNTQQILDFIEGELRVFDNTVKLNRHGGNYQSEAYYRGAKNALKKVEAFARQEEEGWSCILCYDGKKHRIPKEGMAEHMRDQHGISMKEETQAEQWIWQ